MKKYQRIWSKKILRVLEFYNYNKNLFLFGITGDIDNLGIFVSQYGRPLAENLVDVYNHLIGIFMYKFAKKHLKTIPMFCMIPSGEEVFAIGVTTELLVANEFFLLLKNEINNFINESALFSNKDVTVSFGCKVFSGDAICNAVSRFIRLDKKRQVQESSSAYLKLMLIMRRELAYELDRSKFNSLNASNLDLVVFFRNIVYANLRNYKRETKQTLIMFANRLNRDATLRECLQSTVLNFEYGITDKSAHIIKELLVEKKGE